MEPENAPVLISYTVCALRVAAKFVFDVSRASEMYKRLSTFDAIISTLLNHPAVLSLERESYDFLLNALGLRILDRILSTESALSKIHKYNCERMLMDCYCH